MNAQKCESCERLAAEIDQLRDAVTIWQKLADERKEQVAAQSERLIAQSETATILAKERALSNGFGVAPSAGVLRSESCKHCGKAVEFDQWSYVHKDTGWANCGVESVGGDRRYGGGISVNPAVCGDSATVATPVMSAAQVLQEVEFVLKNEMNDSEAGRKLLSLSENIVDALKSFHSATGPSYADIAGAVARGWCSPNNAHKVMDTELAFAIAAQVAALIAPADRETTK